MITSRSAGICVAFGIATAVLSGCAGGETTVFDEASPTALPTFVDLPDPLTDVVDAGSSGDVAFFAGIDAEREVCLVVASDQKYAAACSKNPQVMVDTPFAGRFLLDIRGLDPAERLEERASEWVAAVGRVEGAAPIER